jgi:uncharacterized protein involved in exopolysaccharide biosynthesis
MTQPNERSPASQPGASVASHPSMAPEPSAMTPVLRLGASALRHRRYTLLLPVLVVAATLSVSLLLPRTYTAVTSFVPQSQDASLSRLAGLAAQFGVAIPGQSGALSADFYADLVVASTILGPIVEERFAPVGASEYDRSTLVQLLRARGADSAARHEDAVKRLRRKIAVSADAKTSVVTVQVESRWPAVSQQVASRLVSGVIDFDLHVRQSRASAERQFTEDRLSQVKLELREAEDRLQAFLDRNRQYREAPQLQFQYDRLSREVTSRQQVYTSLQQSFEQARIDEVRNIPRVTIIESARLPARPNSRHLVLRALLAALAAGLVGLTIALVSDGILWAAADQREELEAIRSGWRSLAAEVRRPWRLLRRRQAGR